MKSTGIKVVQLTNEEMLNHTSKDYNQSAWKESVNRMIKNGAKFYEAKPDETWSYSRFFTEYKIDEGLYFLSSYNPFMASLTNRGFKRAFIIDNEIFTKGFGENGDEGVVNTKEGRKWLVDNICKYGVMITSSL